MNPELNYENLTKLINHAEDVILQYRRRYGLGIVRKEREHQEYEFWQNTIAWAKGLRDELGLQAA